jgi:hypothetical protein
VTSSPPPPRDLEPARVSDRGRGRRATGGPGQGRLTDLVVPALDAVVEGSWIALVYVVIELGPAHGAAAVGVPAFVFAAAVGVAWARWVDRGTRHERWAWVPWVLALAAGAAGWLADPATRAALASAGVDGAGLAPAESAVSTNVAGWLLGLAVLRGATHEPGAVDDERAATMLDRVLLLAIPWALGLAFADDDRPAFVAAALVATLLFVGAALLAVGIGRLESLGASAGVDWRRNRGWVVILGGVTVAILAISVPAAFLAGTPPGAMVEVLWAPVAAAAGLVGLVTAAFAAPILSGFEAVLRVLPTPGPTRTPVVIPPLDSGAGAVATTQADPRIGLTIAILTLTAVAIAFVLLVARPAARRARERRPSGRSVPPEERSIVLPGSLLRAPTLRLRARRRPAPTTAVAAYLALLDDVADDAILARHPSESPRAHARRIRSLRLLAPVGPRPDASATRRDRAGPSTEAPEPTGSVSSAAGRDPDADLALLVADWELTRYAGRTLTAAEDRRGVARWRRLRAVARPGMRGRRPTREGRA